jgi:flagellar hook-associated protein 3 FlgL
MRVVESNRYAAVRSQVTMLTQRIDRASTEVASGRKVQNASDAPSAAALAQRLARATERASAFGEVAARISSELEMTDTALVSAGDALSRARELASQFGSGGWNDAAWQGAEQSVSEIREALLSAANTKVGSRYIFSGVNSDRPAFADDGTYQGSATAHTVEVQSGTEVSLLRGDEAFASDVDAFALLDAFEAAVAARDDAQLRALSDSFGEAFSQVVAAREQAGRRVNVADQARMFGDVLREQYVAQRAAAVDADFVASVSTLQEAELGLQFAVQVASTREDLDVLRRL